MLKCRVLFAVLLEISICLLFEIFLSQLSVCSRSFYGQNLLPMLHRMCCTILHRIIVEVAIGID